MRDTRMPSSLTELLTATELDVDRKRNLAHEPVINPYWLLRHAKSDMFMWIFTSYAPW